MAKPTTTGKPAATPGSGGAAPGLGRAPGLAKKPGGMPPGQYKKSGTGDTGAGVRKPR